jgi:hypothetical protein
MARNGPFRGQKPRSLGAQDVFCDSLMMMMMMIDRGCIS